MGRRGRDNRRPPPVGEGHFRLLREYGKNALVKRMGPREREQMWAMACNSAGVPVVEHAVVVDYWKQYIGGLSQHSGIALNGDVDPKYVTLGVTWSSRITAAHTTKTTSLLKRVMGIFAKSFESRAEFLDAAEHVCMQVADRIHGPRPKSSEDRP